MATNRSGLKIEGRPGGALQTMSYWLTDQATGQWALVDPTYEVVAVWRERLRQDQPPQAVFITHGHFDHVGGLAELRRLFPAAPVWVHPDSRVMLNDPANNGAQWASFPYEPAEATNFYREGDVVQVGETALKVLDAPGHCPGSVLLLADGTEGADGQLLAGDVLFEGSVGRWDLPGADYDWLSASIREKIMTLPDPTIIYPGHGPETTVGDERRYNPIVQKMIRGEKY